MPATETPLQNNLMAAAAALTGADLDLKAAALLGHLDYDDGDLGASAARARMLRAAASFRRLFRLPVPDAPGMVFFGAEADPASLGSHNAGLPAGGFAGSGLDVRRAFESCVGEGVEYLSQFAQQDDPLRSGPVTAFKETLDTGTRDFVEALFVACRIPNDRAVSWIQMRRLHDGAPCWFPADLCLRRAIPDFVPPLKLSTGCAAGATLKTATLHAMLELIERDSAALWWRGGRRGRVITPDGEPGQAVTALLAQMRRDQNHRQTSLLDITTDLGVPVVVAFSISADGNDFAFGLGSRVTPTEAACSAVFEMCQSELSLHVIAAKRNETGDAALNDSDRRQQARATTLDPRKCLLLQPLDRANTVCPDLADDPLEAITRRLWKSGIVTYTLDLTRSRFDVPVVRVIAPTLQLDPCEIVSQRLTRMIAETGGGAKHAGGILLL